MVYKVTNGNVYLEGGKLAGKFSEITFPDLQYKMSDFSGLGMMADLELPSGVEKMECSIKFNAIYADEFAKLCNLSKPANLIFRGNKEGFTQAGRSTETNITIAITGIAKNVPLGGFKANEMTELELKMTVWSCTVTDAGAPVLQFDAFSNTLVVGGQDMTAGFRINS